MAFVKEENMAFARRASYDNIGFAVLRCSPKQATQKQIFCHTDGQIFSLKQMLVRPHLDGHIGKLIIMHVDTLTN